MHLLKSATNMHLLEKQQNPVSGFEQNVGSYNDHLVLNVSEFQSQEEECIKVDD